MNKEYLPMNADTEEEVIQYYKVRSQELDMCLTSLQVKSTGVYHAILLDMESNKYYNSLYVPQKLRGKGLIKEHTNIKNIVTIKDCKVEDVLDKLGFDFKILTGWYDYKEYDDIKNLYKNNKAKRSGEFLMWHITRGCNILKSLDATPEAIKAYMLHPIFQSDMDYKDNWKLLRQYDDIVQRNVLEYRKVANSYLCKEYTDSWEVEELQQACPIIFEDIRKMLLADKIQNFEDFRKYHKGVHKRSFELNKYFQTWIRYLNL